MFTSFYLLTREDIKLGFMFHMFWSHFGFSAALCRFYIPRPDGIMQWLVINLIVNCVKLTR